MFKVVGNPDTGKTRKLLEECAKAKNGLFVCAHPDRVFDKCKAYEIEPVQAVGYNEYICEAGFDYCDCEIFIDELDKFLNILDNNIKGYSITVEN